MFETVCLSFSPGIVLVTAHMAFRLGRAPEECVCQALGALQLAVLLHASLPVNLYPSLERVCCNVKNPDSRPPESLEKSYVVTIAVPCKFCS